MRIWDIHPGYLNRQSLLGEHRELHGVAAILSKGLAGYSRHPETLRWTDLGWALQQRHRLLAAEMAFRGYQDRSPIRLRKAPGRWPETFIDPPGEQFARLAEKYAGKDPGRIRLPRSSHELWAQHKYSLLARDQAAYREFGRRVSRLRGRDGFDAIALELTWWLRKPPTPGNLRNALDHMRGHLRTHRLAATGTSRTLAAVQRAAREENDQYLLAQTALSDLAAWHWGVDQKSPRRSR